jgi:4-amino-4-deoxy-L-arabinose transferase-like glycosyltransferase
VESKWGVLDGVALRVAQGVVVLLILLKCAQLFSAGPFMDETYYWMWGQHPALSYFDHPPLNAWLLGLSSAVFGWNVVALRVPVLLGMVADFAALYFLSRQIAGPQGRAYFWTTLLLFLVTPVFWMVTTYALPDHLLVPCCLFAILFFFRFFQSRSEGGPGRTADLYLGALSLGFAGLAKYNAAFLGLGVVAFVLLYDRALLRQGRIYIAAGLALAVQAPVIAWNATESLASWQFILQGRHAGLRASIYGLVPWLAGTLIVISPILFWPIAKFVLSRRASIPGAGFAQATFAISTISIVAVASTTATLFHWNLVAYAAMLPFLVAVLRPKWLLALQTLYGTVFAIAVFINYSVVPITNVDGWRDEATAWSYGWPTIAEAVAAAQADHPGAFVATVDYTTASLLGFAMADGDVISLSARTDQYDYWFDRAAHTGGDAILIGDRWRPLRNDIMAQFTSVTEIAHVDVERGGRALNTARIYLAVGFKPDG